MDDNAVTDERTPIVSIRRPSFASHWQSAALTSVSRSGVVLRVMTVHDAV